MGLLEALNQREENGEERLYRELREAESVVIGAGAGLSTSAGFVYDGNRFRENFLQVVKDKDYFVLTTNVDHCFQRSGFDKKRLFYTQGDFGLWQCAVPCHKKTYDNEDVVKRMAAEQKDMRIPGELIPLCPVCGKPMTMNLRADSTFVEDEGWHEACGRYEHFLEKHKNSRVLFLELGCGMNTPGIVKFSFWRLTSEWPGAFYGCINLGEAYAPQEIERKSVCISEDIGRVLAIWKGRMEDEKQRDDAGGTLRLSDSLSV